ncbi:MAG: hypothetical protein H3C38_10995 [Rhodospirillales bacterium]|nr:hypothetical protein [Rhodospirillales bacterium]
MIQTAWFGTDAPIAAAALPSTNTDLSWYNVQRKRLQKFAKQFKATAPMPVETLRSQGEPDITDPDVVATRGGFTQLRRDLPVIDQYYEYSGEAEYLTRVQDLVVAWCRTNYPDGKPINETNFEWLLKVIKRRRATFTAAEGADVDAWVQRLRVAKEEAAAGSFGAQMVEGEGTTLYGNWWTHHYKVLLWVYEVQGDTAAKNALLNDIDAFSAQNFPFGNAAITYPPSYAVAAANRAGGYFDISGGDYRAQFPAGTVFVVSGNTQGKDGSYTVASNTWFSGSNRTRLYTTTIPLPGGSDGGGGTLGIPFHPAVHDMPRVAVVGESIDYIRRDALHYHVYTLYPWIEIALLSGSRYLTLINNGWSFFQDKLLSPVKHYEFANTTDTFDGARWQSSHPEYLAPNAMFKPHRASGLMLAYHHYRRTLDPDYLESSRDVAMIMRAFPEVASFWPQYFRWALGYGANA